MGLLPLCEKIHVSAFRAELSRESRANGRTSPTVKFLTVLLETACRIDVCSPPDMVMHATVERPFVRRANATVAFGLRNTPLSTRWGGAHAVRTACRLAQNENCVGRKSCRRTRAARGREKRGEPPRSGRAAEACEPRRRASTRLVASGSSLRIQDARLLPSCLLGVSIKLNLNCRQVVHSPKHISLDAIDSRGPNERAELRLRHRSTPRRYRVAACVNSLLDPSARARNLRATSVSTQEDTETELLFYAWSDSPIEPHLLRDGVLG
jgi:hypothetical protein